MATRRRSTRPAASGQQVRRPKPDPSPVRLRRFEFRRKLLHSSIGFIALAGLERQVSLVKVIHGLTGALVIIVSADVLRFRSQPFARLYERLLGPLMRPSERYTWNGVIWYLMGCIYCLTLLPPDLGVFSIVMLSWVDTAASTVGRTLGRYTPAMPSLPFGAKKSVGGFAGAFGMGYVAATYFWQNARAPSWQLAPHRQLHPRSFDNPFPPIQRLPSPSSTLPLQPLVLLSALIAALAESIDLYGLDDNVSLPVLFGTVMYGLLAALR